MSGSNVTASGVFVESHDTFQYEFVDCRVLYTYGGNTLTLPVNVPKTGFADPQNYTRQELADGCAAILGFPVSAWAPDAPPEEARSAPQE